MLLAQISDTHIAPSGRRTYGFVPMAENLQKCVAHINARPLRPDLVVLSGDVTNDFSRNEALRAKSILDGLDMPYVVIPGNHDDRDVLYDVFAGPACPGRVAGFICYTLDLGPLRLVALDSTRKGAAGGELCKTRRDWLEAQLAENDKPVILALHHPPLACGVPESDEDGFLGAGELGEIVARHPDIERILCGHIHLHTHARWNGTVVTTAPSMGMPLDLDLTQAHPSRFLIDAPAYLLHHWTGAGDLITHHVRVETLDGPYDFVDREEAE